MFKIISIDVTGIEKANKLLTAYAKAVSDPSTSAKDTDAQQRVLESYVGRIFGAKITSGKLGQKTSTDYLVPSDSKLLTSLYQSAIENDYTPVEFKGSTKQAVTIGQITIGGRDKDLYSSGSLDPFTDASVKQNILGKRLGSKEGYLVDLDPNLSKATDKSAYIFNNYFKKDARLKDIFYSKASTLLLGNTYNINDINRSRLVGLQVPKKYFNNTFFKATVVDKAIVISIRDNFQKNFIRELNDAYVDIKKSQKGYKKYFTVAGKRYSIDYLPVQEGTEFFGLEITNSIKSRPIDTFKIRAAISYVKKAVGIKQKIISNAQWTILTRKRLGQTMLTYGAPNPPDLKERSGRFRGSVMVMHNERNNTLRYLYNPLYSSLKDYGYRPDLQIETAIRHVAQSLYTEKFNIVSGAGL